ncbi:hypothetical protein Emed_007040 [Eimeria media]
MPRTKTQRETFSQRRLEMRKHCSASPLTRNEHDASLTIVDPVGKMARFVLTKTHAKPAAVASLSADRLVGYRGLLEVRVSDRDTRVAAESDVVWVSTKYTQATGTPKLQPQFVGLFKVLKGIGKVAYDLDLASSMQVHPVFHVYPLQRDKPRPSDMLQPLGWRPVSEAEEDEDPEFKVEHLSDLRGRGETDEFLVKWRGYPVGQATWEPLSNLGGCRDPIRAFRASKTRCEQRQQKPP